MLPSRIDIPAAWFGEELAKKPNIWHYTLQDEEIHELISAAIKFCASGEELGKINPKNFVLNKFDKSEREVIEEFKKLANKYFEHLILKEFSLFKTKISAG